MDEKRARLRDDLLDLVTGDVLVDELSRAAYSTDASIMQVRPQAIVIPKTMVELQAVVKYAAENGVRLHPRGAGTGFAGESLGGDVVVDTSRHFQKIEPLADRKVRVQPGVKLWQLQDALRPHGRMFAPDPISGDRCTIGGMLATNATGPRSLRYGTTGDHVIKIKVVMPDGGLLEVGKEPLAAAPMPTARDPRVEPRSEADDIEITRIATSVAQILGPAGKAIDAEQPAALLKSGGYQLRGVLRDGSVDLPRLLVGSEGTLAFFVEAELATVPIPCDRGALLAFFPTLEAAALAALAALEFQPTACEMLDRRLLSLARDADRQYAEWIPERAEALLLFEQEGNSPENVAERLHRMAERIKEWTLPGAPARRMASDHERDLAWGIRSVAIPSLARHCGDVQPIPFVENAAVPPLEFPRFLKMVQEIVKRQGVTASYNAHIGTGVLHTRPLLDLRNPIDRTRLEIVAREVHDAAIECGGTFNGEHGVGLLRSGFLPRQFPKLYPVFCKIKAVFDPLNILNPGKIVGAEQRLPIDKLRIPASVSPDRSPPAPKLVWAELPLVEHADRCNGCGGCATAKDSIRMCPTFKVDPTEMNSPRTKANLMRQIVYGTLDGKELATDSMRRVADLCVQCKMCRVECPSAVDISKLMLEAKAANVAEHGMSRTDWFFANLESWSNFASKHAAVMNRLLTFAPFRWLAEKTVGLSRHRRLPRFHRKTFLRRAIQFGWTKKPRKTDKRPKVALLVDVFPNTSDPHLAECAARVLEHLGRAVYVPVNQRASGMAALQYGDLDEARRCVEANVEVFAELAREGYDIVSTEPSAVLMFRDDARGLVADPDLDLLGRKTYEFSEYLARLAAQEGLADGLRPVPLTVAYHEPCHLRALHAGFTRQGEGPVDLLRRIPQFRVVPMDLGCSGMAGTFGMRSDSFEMAMAAGKPMLDRLKASDIHFGVTQCSACRMQMEQGAEKRTLHPAEWLALSYGVARRPEKLFRRLPIGPQLTS